MWLESYFNFIVVLIGVSFMTAGLLNWITFTPKAPIWIRVVLHWWVR